MQKRTIITLEPGEILEVHGAYSEYESTSLYHISWSIEEGWASTTCTELSDDSDYHSLANNWEVSPDLLQ